MEVAAPLRPLRRSRLQSGSLLGLLASDANQVGVITAAATLSTAAGVAVKKAMDRHGQ